MRRGRLSQGVHEKFAPEGAQADAHRRKAVSVFVGRLHVEIRQVGRADATLQEAHGPEAVQLQPVPEVVQSVRPSVPAHETALISDVA